MLIKMDLKTFIVLVLSIYYQSIVFSNAASLDSSILSENRIPSPRIVDGTKAYRGQFPYQAGLLFNGNVNCGGSLISDTWILTAAHCVFEVEAVNTTIELGAQTLDIEEEGRVILKAAELIPHPEYGQTFILNDIALVKLDDSVELSEYIQIINLPTYSDSEISYDGEGVQVSGWGLTSDNAGGPSNELNYVNLTIISNEVCASVFGSNIVTKSVICTGSPNGEGVCSSDSGGPLVIHHDDGTFTQIGVVSFGGSSCEDEEPSGYTRVTSYLDWISNITGIVINS